MNELDASLMPDSPLRPRVSRFPARGSVEPFVQRHIFLWEGTLAVLAVIYLVLALGGEELSLHVPEWVLFVFAGLFMAEFTVRFLNAEDRKAYARHHWVDAVTAIPLLGPLRALRLLRLLRLVGALRILTLADRAGTKGGGGRTSLRFLGPLLLLVWLGTSYAFWNLEHGVNPQIKGFGDAMYMAFSMTATLGNGNHQPSTAGGQILGGLLIFFCLGLVGFVSSQLTARLLHQADPMEPILIELGLLRAELGELRGASWVLQS